MAETKVDFYAVARAHADRLFKSERADDVELAASALNVVFAEVLHSIILGLPQGTALKYKDEHEAEIEHACVEALAHAGFTCWREFLERKALLTYLRQVKESKNEVD